MELFVSTSFVGSEGAALFSAGAGVVGTTGTSDFARDLSPEIFSLLDLLTSLILGPAPPEVESASLTDESAAGEFPPAGGEVFVSVGVVS